MCDCKKKLIDLTEKHKLCNTVRFENPIKKTKDPEPIIELLEFHRSTEDDSPCCPISTEEVHDEVQCAGGDSTSSEEEDDIVELTDISPEELIAQEEEEKRIKDELALIQLTKLTKKKVRTKK